MRKLKWILMCLATGGVLPAAGCLSALWTGLSRGAPSDNPLLNLALDVIKEATVYGA